MLGLLLSHFLGLWLYARKHDEAASLLQDTLLAERIAALKPRGDEDFGTSEEWRYYNSLYFPYVVGVRAYAQNATAAGLDPTARRAWQWLVTEVPQRSLHNWQNAAARVIAADLRDGLAVSGSTQDRPGSNR